MLKGIIAEIKYNLPISLVGAAFIVAINIILIIVGRWNEAQGDFPGLRSVWISASILFMTLIAYKFRKENRYRMIIPLPVSQLSFYIFRTVTLFGYTGLLFVLLILFDLLMNKPELLFAQFVGHVKLLLFIFIICILPIISQNYYCKFKASMPRRLYIIFIIFVALSFLLSSFAFTSIGENYFPAVAEILTFFYKSVWSIPILIIVFLGEVVFDYYLLKTSANFTNCN